MLFGTCASLGKHVDNTQWNPTYAIVVSSSSESGELIP